MFIYIYIYVHIHIYTHIFIYVYIIIYIYNHIYICNKRNELRAAVLFLEPKRQVRQQIELSSDLQTGFPA